MIGALASAAYRFRAFSGDHPAPAFACCLVPAAIVAALAAVFVSPWCVPVIAVTMPLGWFGFLPFEATEMTDEVD